jgi:hypothetical protein
MKGDVTVFGMTMGQCFLEDIRTSVPHMEVVVIPAAQAYSSRDLWLAINQRKVFQLHSGVKTWSSNPGTVPTEVVAVAEQNKLLQQALEDQKAQNAAILAAMA